jgi:hypothetical protein
MKQISGKLITHIQDLQDKVGKYTDIDATIELPLVDLSKIKEEDEVWVKFKIDEIPHPSNPNKFMGKDTEGYRDPLLLDDIVAYFPAPLATEILEELPYKINKEDYLVIRKCRLTYFYVEYWDLNFLSEPVIKIKADTLPNALAKMWLYLRKENLS